MGLCSLLAWGVAGIEAILSSLVGELEVLITGIHSLIADK